MYVFSLFGMFVVITIVSFVFNDSLGFNLFLGIMLCNSFISLLLISTAHCTPKDWFWNFWGYEIILNKTQDSQICLEWIKENITNPTYLKNDNCYKFFTKEDAMAFKLAICEHD